MRMHNSFKVKLFKSALTVQHSWLYRVWHNISACTHILISAFYCLSVVNTVKPALKEDQIGLQDRISLNAGQKYCRMLQGSIMQYFWPSLSYHLSLLSLFCLFLSDRLRQVLLYYINLPSSAIALLIQYILWRKTEWILINWLYQK